MTLDQFLRGTPHGLAWVFGYASLMWSPGFRPAERAPALLHGFHRTLSIYSHRHRGTADVPGLVMGLARGGCCRGVAFRIPRARRRAVLAMLWRREMRNYVYQPRPVALRLADGRRVTGVAFVADTAHRQYAGRLSVERTARLVAQGHGERGRNVDYLRNTLAHMHELGVPDARLERVLARVEALHRSATRRENRA